MGKGQGKKGIWFLSFPAYPSGRRMADTTERKQKACGLIGGFSVAGRGTGILAFEGGKISKHRGTDFSFTEEERAAGI